MFFFKSYIKVHEQDDINEKSYTKNSKVQKINIITQN